MLLITLLTACQTTKYVTVETTVVPELDFPIFPKDSKMINHRDGTVTVSADWIVRLEEFRIVYESTKKDYEQIKELYESR